MGLRFLWWMRGAALAVPIVFGWFHAGMAGEAKRPVTIEDLLRLEMTGRAVASADGDLFVYDRMPPYKDRPDFGTEATNTSFSSGRLMLVNAVKPRRAKLLFPPRTDAGYWVASFSPRGDRVAFYMVRRGQVSLGVYDLRLHKTVMFGPAPQFRTVHGMSPLWLSNDRIAYAAMSPGAEPWRITARRTAGQMLMTSWEKSWRGREPSFREVQSPDNPRANMPLPGMLVVGDATAGSTKILAQGLFEDTTASPDGRYLAALRQYPLAAAANAADWLTTRSELWLFDVRKNAGRPIDPDKTVFINSLAWDDKSDRLAFFAWPRAGRPVNGLFHVLDADTGVVGAWPHTGLALASAREHGQGQEPEPPLWFKGSLVVFARRQSDPNAPPTFVYQDYRNPPAQSANWYLIDPSGTPKEITGGFSKISPVLRSVWRDHFFAVADGDVWQIDSGKSRTNLTRGRFGNLQPIVSQDAYFHLPQPSHIPAYLLSGTQDGRSVAVLVRFADAAITTFAFSAADRPLGQPGDNGAFLIRHFKDQGGSSVVLGKADGSTFDVDDLNGYIADIQRLEWIPLTYKSSIDGSDQSSCLMLPPGASRDTPVPLVVFVYPSHRACLASSAPLDMYPPEAMDMPPELFAAHGYAYLDLASPSQLQRDVHGPLARLDRVTLDAVNAAVALGYVDAHRVGLFGGSQGGISILSIVTQTDAFKSAVSINGWVDPWRHYFDSSIYQIVAPDENPFGGEAARYEFSGDDLGLGASPWSDPQRYLQNSPLAHADRIHTPLLLINSDMDVTPAGEYEAMFAALYRLHKRAKLITYWGEGHAASSPANIRHAWTSVLDWFDATLKNVASDVRQEDDSPRDSNATHK